jgi:hypothetical protein
MRASTRPIEIATKPMSSSKARASTASPMMPTIVISWYGVGPPAGIGGGR